MARTPLLLLSKQTAQIILQINKALKIKDLRFLHTSSLLSVVQLSFIFAVV